jgi:hypothetical protein
LARANRCSRTHAYEHTHTHTHTHSLSLSLSHTHTHSLSHINTHTHTHTHTRKTQAWRPWIRSLMSIDCRSSRFSLREMASHSLVNCSTFSKSLLNEGLSIAGYSCRTHFCLSLAWFLGIKAFLLEFLSQCDMLCACPGSARACKMWHVGRIGCAKNVSCCKAFKAWDL